MPLFFCVASYFIIGNVHYHSIGDNERLFCNYFAIQPSVDPQAQHQTKMVAQPLAKIFCEPFRTKNTLFVMRFTNQIGVECTVLLTSEGM